MISKFRVVMRKWKPWQEQTYYLLKLTCVRWNVPAWLRHANQFRHFTRKIEVVLNSLKIFIQGDVRCKISNYLYLNRIMKYSRRFLSTALTSFGIFFYLGPHNFVKPQSCTTLFPRASLKLCITKFPVTTEPNLTLACNFDKSHDVNIVITFTLSKC